MKNPIGQLNKYQKSIKKEFRKTAILLIIGLQIANAQTKKTEFMPTGHLFEPILLDPLEAQAYAGVGRALNNNLFDQGVYGPFSIGFIKPIVRWNTKKNQQRELALDVANFTQFEIFYDKTASKVRRFIINSDYKVSVSFNTKIDEEKSYRIRFYHISSHLGDDYLIKNAYTSNYVNPVNYEQADFTYSIQKKNWRYYALAGYGIRPYFKPTEVRKRVALEAGMFWKKPMQKKKNMQWVAGFDLRMLEQTDFRPGIKTGFGIRIGEESKTPFNFIFEYYNGPLPYSKFESEPNAQLLGASFYFNPF
jgi:hypothetical protein